MFVHSRIVFCLAFSLVATLPPVPSLSQVSVSQASDAARSAQKTTDSAPPGKQVIALFNAAEQGDTAKVTALLDSGVSVKSQYPNGLTPLILATMMNHPDAVELLLDRGADVNAAFAPGASISGSTALIMATDTFACMMAGAKTPPTPAGYDGHEIEFMKQHPDQVRQWEEKTAAWEKGYGVIVRMLLDHGANVNAQTKMGTTAISNAAESGEMETVRLLLAKGARLDLPVHGIIMLGDKQDATNGYVALAGATSMGQDSPEMVKLLLSHGATPNAKSFYDMTPLGRASESGAAEVVQMLLEAGANVNACDAFGKTALMLAQRNKHAGVVALLRQAGAKDLPEGPHPEVMIQEVKPKTNRTSKGVETRPDLIPSSDHVYTITRHVDKPKDAVK